MYLQISLWDFSSKEAMFKFKKNNVFTLKPKVITYIK